MSQAVSRDAEQPLRALWQRYHAYRARFIGAVVASKVNKFADVMPELLIGAAVDVVVRGNDELVATVHERSGGAGARAVFDSVGRDTFDESLGSLARRGYLVAFGQSSGPVPPFDVRRLQQAGSVFLTRPGLAHYTATREELSWRASEVLSQAASGELNVRVHHTYPLADAAEAHRDLEGRGTIGKLLLRTPDI